MKHIYNLKPDPADSRDLLHIEPPSFAPLPPLIDLRPNATPPYDQGQLGSCTGNAYAGILDFVHHAETGELFGPSRLFIYWFERYLQNTIMEDSGASMRLGAKVCAKYGACKETTWPYDIDRFTVRPTAVASAEALGYQALSYARVAQSLNQMRLTLAAGRPIAIGISVYDSFESDEVSKTGIVPLPDTHKESLLGGHALGVYGYDDAKQWLIVRNSWGLLWGDKGYCYIPYKYILNPRLANDFWVIKKAE